MKKRINGKWFKYEKSFTSKKVAQKEAKQRRKIRPTRVLPSGKNWDLWKLCQDLSCEEISILITNRKEKLKYETNGEMIKILRTDISILEDAYKIKLRKRK